MYLKIKRSAMDPMHKRYIGYTYKVEVVEAVGLPAEIFVFLRVPKPSDPNQSDDEFQNIASPSLPRIQPGPCPCYLPAVDRRIAYASTSQCPSSHLGCAARVSLPPPPCRPADTIP